MAYPIGDLCEWSVLNDTIMGGSSSSACRLTAEGLLLEGNIVEQGGGFVSCRSPRFQPPLNLSAYRALRICVDGEGRTLKFALACSDGVMGLSELIPGGLRWVHSIRTNSSGTTVAEIQFQDLRPVIRAVFSCSIPASMTRVMPILDSEQVRSDCSYVPLRPSEGWIWRYGMTALTRRLTCLF